MNFLNDLTVSGDITATGTLQSANLTLTGLSTGSYTSVLVENAGVVYKRNLSTSLLPSGTEGQMLYNDAGTWTATSSVKLNDTVGALELTSTSSASIFRLIPSGRTSVGLQTGSSSAVNLSFNTYFDGTGWVHSAPAGITSSSVLQVAPGSGGVKWYASSNSSVSWNVTSGKTLWTDTAIWSQPVSTSGGTMSGSNQLLVGSSELTVGSSAIAQFNGFVRVGSLYLHDAAGLVVATNNFSDIGSTSLRFKKAWLVDADLSGTLNVSGATTIGSTLTSGYHIINGGDGTQANEYTTGLSVRGSDTLNRIQIVYDAANDRGTIAAIRSASGWRDLCLQPIGGNVGIGGAAGGYKLQVNGTANFTGATTVGGTLGVTGAATFSANVVVAGNFSRAGGTTYSGDRRLTFNVAQATNANQYHRIGKYDPTSSKSISASTQVGGGYMQNVLLRIMCQPDSAQSNAGNVMLVSISNAHWGDAPSIVVLDHFIYTSPIVTKVRVSKQGSSPYEWWVDVYVTNQAAGKTDFFVVEALEGGFDLGYTANVSSGTNPTEVTLSASGFYASRASSSSVITALNADLLDGQHGSYYENRDTTAVGFASGTLTLTRAAGNLTVSLDGRYLPLTAGIGVALTDKLRINSAQPGIVLFETDTTDKNWWIDVESGTLRFLKVNDALNSWTNALAISEDGGVTITSTNPRLQFYESDGSTDQKRNDFISQINVFYGRFYNDAGSLSHNWLSVSRNTGTYTAATLTLNASTISLIGALTTSSTALVTNLNADQLDGQHGSYYNDITNGTLPTTWAVGIQGANLAEPYLMGVFGDALAFRTISNVEYWNGSAWISYSNGSLQGIMTGNIQSTSCVVAATNRRFRFQFSASSAYLGHGVLAVHQTWNNGAHQVSSQLEYFDGANWYVVIPEATSPSGENNYHFYNRGDIHGTWTTYRVTITNADTVNSATYCSIQLMYDYSRAGLPNNYLPISWDYLRNVSTTGTLTGSRLISTISTGTAPLTVTSTTMVSNLQAQYSTNLFGGAAGGLPYQTAANTSTFLALGTTNHVLTAGASAPQWVAQSTLTAGAATNIAITNDTATNATMYPVWVTANTGNLPAKVSSTKFAFNPSSGNIDVYGIVTSSHAVTLSAGSYQINATSGITHSGIYVNNIGGKAIEFTNGTSNWIQWNTSGVGAPTFTTSSAGTKLLLYPSAGASAADFAIGIEAGAIWFGLPTTAEVFKWYGGTDVFMTLEDGYLSLGSNPVLHAGNYNSYAPTLTGTGASGSWNITAANATNSAITNDTTTNATMYPVWVTSNTGNLPLKVTSSKLSYNPSSGTLNVAGAISVSGGNVTVSGAQITVGGGGSGFLINRRDTSAAAWQWYSSAGSLELYDHVGLANRLVWTTGGTLTISSTSTVFNGTSGITVSGGASTLKAAALGSAATYFAVFNGDPSTSGTAVVTRTATQVRSDISAATSGAATASGLTMATARLLGRTTASTGAIEEISLSNGTNCSATLASGVLTIAISATPTFTDCTVTGRLNLPTSQPGSPVNGSCYWDGATNKFWVYSSTYGWKSVTLT